MSIYQKYLFIYFILLFALLSWHLILPSTVGYVTYWEELPPAFYSLIW